MSPIGEFFAGLFDTSLWPARWRCGYWSDFHGWLYIISDLMVWTAYFLIPAIILNYISRKSPRLKFPKVYFLFAAFILLCGTTHFFDAAMFWVPMYRLNALIRFITGVVSLLTVYHLVKILPDLFRQKTNLELETEISRRVEAERKLDEANKGLSAFAYMASHDLKEPLRKIRIYSSSLYDKNELIFDEKSKELTQKIIQSSGRLDNIIESILSLSTISDQISFESVNIEDVIREVKLELELKMYEKKAVLSFGPIPAVKGNKQYLLQLFSNLISNAVKFSGESPVILVNAEKKNGRVIIYVKDNGIGIADEFKSKVFEAFYRLNSKTEYEGSGIGLAICKKIVDLHGGSITFEASDGQGTTFIIELAEAG